MDRLSCVQLVKTLTFVSEGYTAGFQEHGRVCRMLLGSGFVLGELDGPAAEGGLGAVVRGGDATGWR